MAVFNIRAERLKHFDMPRRFPSVTVTGNSDEVDLQIGIDVANQIRQKNETTVQHTDQDRLFTVKITGNLFTQFFQSFMNLFLCDHYLVIFRHHDLLIVIALH